MSAFTAPWLSAQENNTVPRLSMPDKTPDILGPGSHPDVILLRNEMGESFVVPKIKYEEFERYLRSEDEAAPVVSSAALSQLDVHIDIQQTIAALKITAEANLTEPTRRWLDVPLGLGMAQAIPSPDSQTNELVFPPLRVTAGNPGYFWRIAPSNQTQHKIEFRGLSNTTVSTSGQSMRLDLPPVPANLRLQLPPGEWDLNVAGTGSEVVEPFRLIDEQSVAMVRTSGGLLTLTWSKKVVADRIQSVEVESQTKYVPQASLGQFLATTTMVIRGPKRLGGRRFTIALPDKCQWRESVSAPASFPIYKLYRSDLASETKGEQLVLEIDEDVSRTDVEIPVEWQAVYPADAGTFEFPIPQIEGVQRHVANVDLVIPRNVTCQWQPQTGIQFVKQLAVNDTPENYIYSFRTEQPSAPIRLQWNVSDRSHMLRGNYEVVCDGLNMQMSGTLEFLGDIRTLPFLQLDVRGWTIDRVQQQPSGRDLDVIGIGTRDSSTNPQGVLSIPLSLGELLEATQPKPATSSPSRPPAEPIPSPTDTVAPNSPSNREDILRPQTRSITFVLSRKLETPSPSDLKRNYAFSLPMVSWIDPESQKRVSATVSGELGIRSLSARLTPDGEISNSLKLIDPLVASKSTNSKDNDASLASSIWRSSMKYRIVNTKSWVEWQGGSESVGAVVQARAQTKIALSEQGKVLSQMWMLSTSGSMPSSVRLAIPKDWTAEANPPLANSEAGTVKDNNNLEVLLDNAPITLEKIAGGAPIGELPMGISNNDSRFVWYRIPFSLGSSNGLSSRERHLSLRRRWDTSSIAQETSTPFDWQLPCLAPDHASDAISIEQYGGEISYDGRWELVLRNALGEPVAAQNTDDSSRQTLAFDLAGQGPRLLGEIAYRDQTSVDSIHLESIWLQSILNAVEQRERFVVRFKTKADAISLLIPPDRMANCEFLLNGRKISGVRNPADLRRLDFPLHHRSRSQSDTEETYVLEAFMWPSDRSEWIKTLSAEPPTVMETSNRVPFVWQVMVPSTIHLIGNSGSLSPGYRWQWQDFWFGRKSDWTQDQLERQLGASSQPLLSQQTNQYVFLALNQNAPMRVWMAPRYLLWSPVAICILLASFLAMEYRWIRSPWIAICILVLGLVASQWAWDLSITIAQCFVAGITIALLFGTIRWVIDRRSRRRSVFASRPSSSLATASRSASLSGSVPATTPAAVMQSGGLVEVTAASDPFKKNASESP